MDRLAAYLDRARTIIAEHGWMIQGVFPTATSPGTPFAYTIGLTASGVSELVISGLDANTAGSILNAAARRHLAEELRPGMVVEGLASVPFVVVAAPFAEVGMARNMYGDRVGAVQLVWPDEGGAYPGDERWSLGDAYVESAGRRPNAERICARCRRGPGEPPHPEGTT